MGRDNAAVTTSLREVLVAETLKKGTRVTGAERDKLAEQLKKRYDSGESIRALAAATGRSYGFIHRILTESGVNLRGRGGATRGIAVCGARRGHNREQQQEVNGVGTIKIPVPVLLLVVIGLALAAIGAQLPEIERYLKVRQM